MHPEEIEYSFSRLHTRVAVPLTHIYPRRTHEKPRRSDKVNEPPPTLFIQVTDKNGERVLVFPSFLPSESRNAMMHFEQLVA